VGLFVEADILGHELEGAVVLPRSILRGDNDVLVVDSESRLRFRDVNVLRLSRTEAVITEGLRAGELVCLSTLEAVTDGMKVRTVKASDDAGGGDSTDAGSGAGMSGAQAEEQSPATGGLGAKRHTGQTGDSGAGRGGNPAAQSEIDPIPNSSASDTAPVRAGR
jgi:hypothetical protein